MMGMGKVTLQGMKQKNGKKHIDYVSMDEDR